MTVVGRRRLPDDSFILDEGTLSILSIHAGMLFISLFFSRGKLCEFGSLCLGMGQTDSPSNSLLPTRPWIEQTPLNQIYDSRCYQRPSRVIIHLRRTRRIHQPLAAAPYDRNNMKTNNDRLKSLLAPCSATLTSAYIWASKTSTTSARTSVHPSDAILFQIWR